MDLKQSTAFKRPFKMISSTDHLSLKASASPVVNISKDGAAFGAAGGAVTEVANGWYYVSLNTTDTNTLGSLAFYITGTGADDTDFADVVRANILGDTLSANVLQWNSTNVATPATAGIPDINVKNIVNTAAAVDANNLLKVDVEDWKAGVVPAVSVTGVPKVDVADWLGTAVTAATAGIPDVNTKNYNNVAAATDANNLPKVDVEDWKAGVVPAVTVTGVPKVDVADWLGTAVTAATAGIPDTNVKNINNVSAGSVTTINANQGTTQPINFTGTAGSALAKGDVIDWNSTAVTTPKTAGTPVVDWIPSGWRSNTAQAGAAGTITLDASASATDSFYKYSLIMLIAGTGAGQARICTAYVGTTKVATIAPNWTTNPDATSVFATMPLAIADIETWLSSVVTAATAGIPDVNAKNVNNVSAASVTTINANLGTTQPENFTGTGASALVKVDVTDIATAAVSTTTAQLGVNVVQYNAQTAQTDASNLPKVDLENIKGAAATVGSSNTLKTTVSFLDMSASNGLGSEVRRLGYFARAMATCLVDTTNFAPTTTQMEFTCSQTTVSASADFWKNTVVGWIDGALSGESFQWRRVTAYSKQATKGHITVSPAFSNAPQSGDEFVLAPYANPEIDVNNDKTGYSLLAGQLFIKKNTGLAAFPFVMRDSTTHAPKPSVTVTATRRIDAGAFAACANAVTEIANGWYTIDIAASDVNGTTVAFRFTGANADDLDFTVVTQT